MNLDDAPVVKVEGLTIYRGNYTAVRDVSFELLPGTDTAIIGPNGSGKSTLVQGILDLIPRSGGKIEIFGRQIQNLGRMRRLIGYIPQNFIFDRSFPISVSELVALGWNKGKTKRFWQHKNKEKQEAIASSLKRVGAYHLRTQAIGTLSGGELKRVLLAYCLVSNRRLLVLDEAFAGLDVSGEADFYSLLHSLKSEQGWTVLQVSHDIDMVDRHCDRVLCLNQTILCSGEPQTILSPQNLLATYGPAFSRYQHHH
ncbi:MAG TPA: ABC transporter ATP-binding protein [Cyanobacteria bacterium UBA11369]|nr:ABC transporter ATP-binding protein [Cyanobacteria bacterium UBA8553]HAZ45542.1 ABC transporter ATP-binding protein [Cyanobacteria bacterium UBA11371]HBE30870.1 ABC transporter ATP-binding protein [Cyanobacteria bacterium UBA11368]HBE52416.1 ABC transporter ATP-binding protein [Cyanobacteria bacterium UBA11369]